MRDRWFVAHGDARWKGRIVLQHKTYGLVYTYFPYWPSPQESVERSISELEVRMCLIDRWKELVDPDLAMDEGL